LVAGTAAVQTFRLVARVDPAAVDAAVDRRAAVAQEQPGRVTLAALAA
jgi:hypothetical protein